MNNTKTKTYERFIYYHTIPTDTMSKILTFKCPKCGKEIQSLYDEQFNQNVEQHQRICNKKEGDK